MISSGQPPFQDDLPYDIVLVFEISKGLRETPVPDTPIGYSKLYTGKYKSFPTVC